MVINRGHSPMGMTLMSTYIQELGSPFKGQLYAPENKKKQQLWICLYYLEDNVPPQTAPEFFYCFIMSCVRWVPPKHTFPSHILSAAPD